MLAWRDHCITLHVGLRTEAFKPVEQRARLTVSGQILFAAESSAFFWCWLWGGCGSGWLTDFLPHCELWLVLLLVAVNVTQTLPVFEDSVSAILSSDAIGLALLC